MRRSGAVLFEVLLALGLFVGAGAFTLGATQNVLAAMERTRRRTVAVDLARAKLAELEAGLITIADLQDASEGLDAVGSLAAFSDFESGGGDQESWEVDVATERTEFTGLVLVVLTVRSGTGEFELDDEAVSITLRQLMSVRDQATEAYELDEMMDDLPDSRTPAAERGR